MTRTGKIVTVYGATGNQGSAVVRSLCQNKRSFHVRAIVRDPESIKARDLSTRGAVLVKADGCHPDQVVEALRGSWAVFININSDDPIFYDADGPTEFEFGKAIIDSAIQAGVKNLVYSSGPPCNELTNGKVSLRHLDSKHQIECYARSTQAFENVIAVLPGYFLENFLFKQGASLFGGFPWETDPEGYLTWRVPYWGGDERVPFLSVADDLGDIVHGVLLSPGELKGRTIPMISEIMSYDRMVEAFSRATGKKARFDPVLPTWREFDASAHSMFEDVKSMFGYTQETKGRYFGREDTEDQLSKALIAKAHSAYDDPQQVGRATTVEMWFRREFAP